MPRNLSIFFRVVLFTAIGLVLYRGAEGVLKPYQLNSVFDDKTRSFYEEPQNTVEVLFLGASTAADGFIPSQLFEEQGICSYNLGSSSQPLLGSYCLAQEAYRLHGETLKTIVLECPILRYNPGTSYYRVVLDELPLTAKYDAVMNWDTPEDDDKLVYLNNLYAYHNRWSELTPQDFGKLSYPTHGFLRGYEPLWNRVLTESNPQELQTPRVAPDPNAKPKKLAAAQRRSFDDLARFCEDHDLELVLVKTPVDTWSDTDHAAIADLAATYNLTFLDMNYEPFFTTAGYNPVLDSREGHHPNDSGAQKITRYVGDYLLEEGLASDVRGDPAYAFMNEQLSGYHKMTTGLRDLRACVDPVDYLAYAMKVPEYTIYLGMDGTGNQRLSAEQRRRLEAMGLDWLASLQEGQSYRAVIQDGKVINEEQGSGPGTGLYCSYIPEMFAEPKQAYFMIFSDMSPEAREAWAYEDTSDEGEVVETEPPTWRVPSKGLTVIIYDNSVDAVVDLAYFRASSNLRRYCEPEALFAWYEAAGADDSQLPWYLWQLKLFNERWEGEWLAQGVDATAAIYGTSPADGFDERDFEIVLGEPPSV